jgi:hypothetical protein
MTIERLCFSNAMQRSARMPLVLTLKIGDDFFVAGERFVVDELERHVACVICRASTGQAFRIVEEHATEILSDVHVSLGAHSTSVQCQLVIAAPRDVPVVRGERYRHPVALRK